jgi:acyl-CoA thioester hydrolase
MRSETKAPDLKKVADYRVVFADCDPMRIVYYGNYFRLFEIGRAELFRSLGHAFPTYIERGLYLAVLATGARYHRPARYDDVVQIYAGVASVGRARLEIRYELRGAGGELLVSGHTEHAILDDDGRPQRMPQEIRDAVGS